MENTSSPAILGHHKRSVSLRRSVVHLVHTIAIAGAIVVLLDLPGWSRGAAILTLGCASFTLLVGLLYSRRAISEFSAQERWMQHAEESRVQIQELFAMTDMLQAAEDHEDAGTILMTTACRLLPDHSGALYVFNNSRDRLDLAKSWNTSDGFGPVGNLSPSACWALKRGKPHLNDEAAQTLLCSHHTCAASTVEVPMMARGQVFGLLMIAYEGADAHAKLMRIRRLSRALADSMSLALSNIALREKLRTQSLRDPLTGLYNRRYMEDALDRYINLAEQSGATISVMMVDLDNFKRLNDEHGHAKGDMVLRDVAPQMVAAVRPSDVVARYGGEELIVILPNCGLDDAVLKAEHLRLRIEALSDLHSVSISASFGVATVPETSTNAIDVIPMADGALYAAKQAGKNCVRVADRRGPTEAPKGPRLAATAAE
jgi:diguanylate cyclase (GGDEF)-like protein